MRALAPGECFSDFRAVSVLFPQLVQPPHKANRINVGFSPGSALSANFSRNLELNAYILGG